jgi:hypothetical protein
LYTSGNEISASAHQLGNTLVVRLVQGEHGSQRLRRSDVSAEVLGRCLLTPWFGLP